MTDKEYKELADMILCYGVLCEDHGASYDYKMFMNEVFFYNMILKKLCTYIKDEKEK